MERFFITMGPEDSAAADYSGSGGNDNGYVDDVSDLSLGDEGGFEREESQEPEGEREESSASKPSPETEEQPVASPETKPEPKVSEEPQRFKVKVNGQEKEVSLAELQQGYALANGANQRFEEANRIKAQAERLIGALHKDPKATIPALLKQLGHNERAVLEEMMVAQYERELMSPEQRALMEERERREALEKQLEADKRAKAEQEEQEQVESLRNEYERTITQALANSSLPKIPGTIRDMANLIYNAKKAGLTVDPNQLAEVAFEQRVAENRAMFKEMDGEKILRVLGEDIADKIRRADLARIRGATQRLPASPKPVARPTAPKAKSGNDYLDEDQYRAMVDSRLDD